jgi:hypothetical protein
MRLVMVDQQKAKNGSSNSVGASLQKAFFANGIVINMRGYKMFISCFLIWYWLLTFAATKIE